MLLALQLVATTMGQVAVFFRRTAISPIRPLPRLFTDLGTLLFDVFSCSMLLTLIFLFFISTGANFLNPNLAQYYGGNSGYDTSSCQFGSPVLEGYGSGGGKMLCEYVPTGASVGGGMLDGSTDSIELVNQQHHHHHQHQHGQVNLIQTGGQGEQDLHGVSGTGACDGSMTSDRSITESISQGDSECEQQQQQHQVLNQSSQQHSPSSLQHFEMSQQHSHAQNHLHTPLNLLRRAKSLDHSPVDAATAVSVVPELMQLGAAHSMEGINSHCHNSSNSSSIHNSPTLYEEPFAVCAASHDSVQTEREVHSLQHSPVSSPPTSVTVAATDHLSSLEASFGDGKFSTSSLSSSSSSSRHNLLPTSLITSGLIATATEAT